ncbi:MAG: YbjN domain-containing protein [Deltaproteobacteria bacterium]|nr:YbjN domain-containing protein [Deltaproteobacteria bacterium]
MNAAEKSSCETIESTLSGNKAFRKIEERMYVVKQGSSYVMISVVPWGDDRAIVRCVAQLVRGVRMEPSLALQLLALNSLLRFGAFAYTREDNLVLFLHSILGGPTLDPEELLATIRDVALIADEWDDRIIRNFGGQRMQDLLEESAMARILGGEPDAFELSAD